jgi:hypothetical protein
MTIEEKVAQSIQVGRNYRGFVEVADKLYGPVLSGGGSISAHNTFDICIEVISGY